MSLTLIKSLATKMLYSVTQFSSSSFYWLLDCFKLFLLLLHIMLNWTSNSLQKRKQNQREGVIYPRPVSVPPSLLLSANYISFCPRMNTRTNKKINVASLLNWLANLVPNALFDTWHQTLSDGWHSEIRNMFMTWNKGRLQFLAL
jgi:hypothetical protein